MTQTVRFSKMHGLGNDFVVIDGINQTINLDQSVIKKLADRHTGIGFDQLLLIKKSNKADFACKIFNSDGSEAEQCGNGIRCAGRFIQEEKLSSKNSIAIETASTITRVTIYDFNTIEAALEKPCFEPEKIPFIAENAKTLYELKLDDEVLKLAVLSLGNPHAILQVPSIKDFPVQETGKKLAAHTAFPNGVNIGFVEIVDRRHVLLRTFERGAGETLACGSNACAAVVAGIANGWLDHRIEVSLPLGKLSIEWKEGNEPILMTGPAEKVFSGQITL